MSLKVVRWMSAGPLIGTALAAAAGIALADLGLFWAYFLLPAIAALFLRWRRTALLFLTAGVFAFRHSIALEEFARFPDQARLEKGGTEYVEVEGTLGRRVDGLDFFFQIDRLRDLATGESRPTSGQVRITLPTDAEPGDRFLLRGALRAAQPSWNPGERDLREAWRRQGVHGRLTVQSARRLQAAPLRSLPLWADRGSRWAEGVLSKDLENSPTERSLFLAMTLGDKSGADDELLARFRDTGTMHLFSVSGLHVGLTALLLWVALSPLGLPRRRLALAVIPLVFGYALLTGWNPPAVRAAVMLALVFIGVATLRKNFLINSLAAAMLVLLAADTNRLFAAGFQLSFSAVAGIILLSPVFWRLAAPWVSPDPFLPHTLLSKKLQSRYRRRGFVVQSLCSSAAAALATAPVMIGDFGNAAPIGILANAVMVPLAFPVLAAAFSSLLAAAAGLSTVSIVFNNAGWLLCKGLAFLAGWFASWPGAGWRFPALERWGNGATPSLLVCRLGFDGGCGILVDGRSGTTLVDCGSSWDFPHVVVPALGWLGAAPPSTLLVTHGDAFHMGGTTEFVREYPGARVLFPPVPSISPTEKNLRAHQSFPSYTEGETQQTPKGFTIELLWAPNDPTPRPADDQAAVLMITARGWRTLWLGDAGFPTQRALLTKFGNKLRCDILVMGRHADDPRFHENFLDTCHPRAILTTQAPPFPYGASFLREAHRIGARVIDQGWNGAALCDFLDSELRLHVWTGGWMRLPRD